MKKAFVIVIISLLCLSGFAQGIYFSGEEGMRLEYADKNAKGKATGYTVYEIQKIERQNATNFYVTYMVSIFDDKHKALMEGMEVIVKVIDGTVYFDGSSLMGKLANNLNIKGNGIIIPSNIRVGQKLDDFSVTIEAIATTSACTDVTVVAEEKLTTEAGTFDTYRIDMKYAGKALFIKTEGTISQWYAKGIGEVKTINYDKKGKIATIKELVNLTKKP